MSFLVALGVLYLAVEFWALWREERRARRRVVAEAVLVEDRLRARLRFVESQLAVDAQRAVWDALARIHERSV